MQGRTIDIAILGGGLAGSLIALAFARTRRSKNILLVEEGECFGGNHVWSFFDSDVSRYNHWLTTPLVVARWDSYDVHFPRYSRKVSTPYRSITGERLDAVLRAELPPEALMTGAKVVSASSHGFTLSDGRTFEAGGVIDARGAGGLPHMSGGWQKFTGQMLRLASPHGLDRPIVMDARVEQIDGYRFVYCLPFSESEVFVEDTRYSDDAELDLAEFRAGISAYAEWQGWKVAEVTREETGVLPVIASGDFGAFWRSGNEGAARAGTRAALLHPLTSYSLPDAVRFARHVSKLRDLSGASLADASYAWAQSHWRRRSFYRMLARMLFGAAAPEKRYRVLERFYRLPQPLIERFYAGKSTRADVLRILAGRPPVPVFRALASLAGKGRRLARLGTHW